MSNNAQADTINPTQVEVARALGPATLSRVLADYVQLTKPRIVLMIVLTVIVAMVAANRPAVSVWLAMHTMIGAALVAASASVLNQWFERELDATMPRTMNRPLPSGRLTAFEALVFGCVLVLIGALQLWYFANAQAAMMALITWVLYLCVYTPMKTRTWWNTAVGTVPGALPVMIGWTAAGGKLTDIEGWLLTLVVVVWQFPHFMAIAWLYLEQYDKAGYKMVTNIEPTGQLAAWHAVIGAIALIPLSVLVLQPQSIVGWGIAILGVVLCLGQVAASLRFMKSRDRQTARSLLRNSLLYLPGILILVTIRAVI
jgi:protoheme IX farnesyltransferase